MAILLTCPCGQRLQASVQGAGRQVRCPACGRALAVEASRVAGTAGPHTPSPLGAALPAEPGGEGATHAFLRPPERPGELGRLGPYRVLRALGEGGMGRVYLAEDPQLRRHVALKVLLPHDAASAPARQRFLREARAQAAIEHDNIVAIYQVGEDRGCPFLAMPLLRGESLDGRLRREPRLPLPEALRIGREIAEGLAAAHERGLIHRDIKPANVWLEGPGGRAKVLDFGLARSLAPGEAPLTQTGAIVGTPAYMAPEQARGEDLDARCDLFSLGCVLYQMAGGEQPFRRPDTLSTLLAVAADPHRPLSALNPQAPPSLGALVDRLLAKKREARPASAGEVARALQALALALAPCTPTPTPPGSDSTVVPDRVVAQGQSAPVQDAALADRLLALLGTDAPAPPGAPSAHGQPGRRRGRMPTRGQAALALCVAVVLLLAVGICWIAFRRLRTEADATHAGPAGPSGPSQPNMGAVQVGEMRCLQGHTGRVLSVAFAPDGLRALSGAGGRLSNGQYLPDSDFTVRLWDLESGSELQRFRGHTGDVWGVALTPDGRTTLSAATNEVRAWDTESGQELPQRRRPMARCRAMALSHDGRRLLLAGTRELHLWELPGQGELCSLPGHLANINAIALSRDGKRALSGGDDRTVRLWDLEGKRELCCLKGHLEEVVAVALSPDATRAVSSSKDNTLRVWDLLGRQELRRLQGHSNVVDALAIAADGRYALSGGGSFYLKGKWSKGSDHSVRLWELDSGRQLHRFDGHLQPVTSVAFAPDGSRALSGSSDQTVRLWGLPR